MLTRIASKAAQEQQVTLSGSEKRHAMWFLFNGFLIHFLTDGCALISHYLPPILTKVNINYTIPEYYLHTLSGQMDSRYLGDPTLDTLTLVEILIMFPLCCLVYYGIVTHACWRTPLQIVTSTFQLMGTFIYVGPELLESPILKHFHYADYNLEFTYKHVVLFWLPFFSNVIWVIVPSYFIWTGCVELSALVELNVGNVIPIDSKTFVFSPLAFDKSNQRQYPTSPHHAKQSEYEIHIINQVDPSPDDLDQPIFDDGIHDVPSSTPHRRRRASIARKTSTPTRKSRNDPVESVEPAPSRHARRSTHA
jgi:hypothetical protein